MKVSQLKKLRTLIIEHDYDSAVELADSLGLPTSHECLDMGLNEVESWLIEYPLKEGYETLLDVTHTSGLAGWYTLDGRWYE